jgi:hypothetical protein
MVAKSDIANLVISGAGENDIKALIKADLSILAKYLDYDKSGNYICFSEFPIGLTSEKIDFVVFAGRSRMEVYLFEAKGAEFNQVNQSVKDGPFHATYMNALDQLVRRKRFIIDKYSVFREHVHSIRDIVENRRPGWKNYNSFTGPTPLKGIVDSEKDISVKYIAIGGKTVNDKIESHKRHAWETAMTDFKLESWDSWLNKV